MVLRVMLTRDVFTRVRVVAALSGRGIHVIPRTWRVRCGVRRLPQRRLRCELRCRCGLCLSLLRIDVWWQTLRMGRFANLTANTVRAHLCPTHAPVAMVPSAPQFRDLHNTTTTTATATTTTNNKRQQQSRRRHDTGNSHPHKQRIVLTKDCGGGRSSYLSRIALLLGIVERW